MDQQRRAAERASAGDETARTQWILSQLRAGTLGADRVWVAARLGDVAAAQAVQAVVAPLPGPFRARFAQPLDRAARRLLSSLEAPWGEEAGSMLGGFVAARGDLGLATRLFTLDAPVRCPSCDAVAPSPLAGSAGATPEAPPPADPLPLDSPRWGQLRPPHAPTFLARLAEELFVPGRAVDPATHESALSLLYNLYHHQGDVYAVTYAIVPHVVRLAERALHGDRVDLLSFAASVAFAATRQKSAPPDLAPAYVAAIWTARRLALEIALEATRDARLELPLAPLSVFFGGIDGDLLERQIPQGEVQVWCENGDAVLIGFDEQGERLPESSA